MRSFPPISLVICFLLLACSGAVVGGGSGGGPINASGIGQHSGPGMDEVAIGPSKADHGGESKDFVLCENLEDDPTKPGTATVRLHVYTEDHVVPDRWVKVVEFNYNRYRYLKTDSDGSLTFTYDVVKPRGLGFVLLETNPSDIPLDTIFSCADESCQTSVSDPIKGHALIHVDASCNFLNGDNPKLPPASTGKIPEGDPAPAKEPLPLKPGVERLDSKVILP